MQNSRIVQLNNSKDHNGHGVVYVMSRDQRVYDNHALLAAQYTALEQKLPLYVMFTLMPTVGVRSYEHFYFMLEGIGNIAQILQTLHIPLLLYVGDYKQQVLSCIHDTRPAAVYFDFSPLRTMRTMQKSIARNTAVPCYVVDTHNIIPVWIASDKQEYAAHTFRKKVHKHLQSYVTEPTRIVKHPYIKHQVDTQNNTISSLKKRIQSIPRCGIDVRHTSGEIHARKHLTHFIKTTLATYAAHRNDPTLDSQSGLSPYLHFGQLSSLRVVLDIMNYVEQTPQLFIEARMPKTLENKPKEHSMNTLFEELIVRKELSDNFCYYNTAYDSLEAAPDWAKKTLQKHTHDKRKHIYTREQWEHATTHDPAWNAAQQQLRTTGKIHGYMRMYWAKKILEWSRNAVSAIQTALYLNDHYSLDGGDPNGYTGVLWSVAGLHDRPWKEREVFGTIRYMNAHGLTKKFNLETYIHTWNKKQKTQHTRI